MSTNSYIRINHNDKIYSIYCHYDGYLQHNGIILYNFYNTPEKILHLLSNGNLSTLKENCDAPTITDPYDIGKHCVYYGRDHGEDGQECKVYALTQQKPYTQFNYTYENGKWYYCTNNNKRKKVLEKKLRELNLI